LTPIGIATVGMDLPIVGAMTVAVVVGVRRNLVRGVGVIDKSVPRPVTTWERPLDQLAAEPIGDGVRRAIHVAGAIDSDPVCGWRQGPYATRRGR